MKKKLVSVLLTGMMVFSLTACAGGGNEETSEETTQEETSEDTGETDELGETEIQVFIAASLNTVMEELAEKYNETQPNVTITFNADSSGTLLTQIQEGYECDIFFSAAQKQMDDLEADGLVKEGTRANVVNNQVVVVSLKDSGTKVTGLENLNEAESIALAGGSVPVGRYTREALISLGTLDGSKAAEEYTTEEEIAESLAAVENVKRVYTAEFESEYYGTIRYTQIICERQPQSPRRTTKPRNRWGAGGVPQYQQRK